MIGAGARSTPLHAEHANAALVNEKLRSRWETFACTVVDRSRQTALIALQGPRSEQLLQSVCSAPLTPLRHYALTTAEVAGIPAAVARTGYTGEDGFELFIDVESAAALWQALLSLEDAVQPVGLGARNTLRLEAGMPLYGHELDCSTTPYDAGLGRVVKLDKPDFVGAGALREASIAPATRTLVGLRVTGRGIARHGQAVFGHDGDEQPSGSVTSGTVSPSLGVPIAMAYLAPRHADAGRELWVDVRGRHVAAEVVALPFYRREPAS